MAKVWESKDNIVGLNVKYIWKKKIKGQNCDFIRYRDKDIEYELFIQDTKYNLHKITFIVTYSKCYSGWTKASWCDFMIEQVNNKGSVTHVPKKYIETKFLNYIIKKDKSFIDDDDIYKDDIIEYSYDGGDRYYPNGYIYINLDYFKLTNRGYYEPTTWLIYNSILNNCYILNDNEANNELDNILYKNILLNVDNIDNIDELKNRIGGNIIDIEISGDLNSDKIIFYGLSNMGKSFIAHEYYNNNCIYETDSSSELDILPVHNVIVLGKKYNFTLDNIIDKIGDCKICKFLQS